GLDLARKFLGFIARQMDANQRIVAIVSPQDDSAFRSVGITRAHLPLEARLTCIEEAHDSTARARIEPPTTPAVQMEASHHVNRAARLRVVTAALLWLWRWRRELASARGRRCAGSPRTIRATWPRLLSY